jgi:hypothetical protein
MGLWRGATAHAGFPLGPTIKTRNGTGLFHGQRLSCDTDAACAFQPADVPWPDAYGDAGAEAADCGLRRARMAPAGAPA